MRYYLGQTSHTNETTFKEWQNGRYYQLMPSAKVTWGGSDGFHSFCNCWMQYVRLYLDWVADSEDKMISLALMNPNGTYFIKIQQHYE